MCITALEQKVKDKAQMIRATDVYEIAQEHKAAIYFKSMRQQLAFSKVFKLNGELLSPEAF